MLQRLSMGRLRIRPFDRDRDLASLLTLGGRIVQTDRAHTTNRVELLAWIEARARETHELRHSVISRGYEPTERYGYELVSDLEAARQIRHGVGSEPQSGSEGPVTLGGHAQSPRPA